MRGAPASPPVIEAPPSLLGRAIRKLVFRKWTLVWLHRDLARPVRGNQRHLQRAAAHTMIDITEESLERLDPYFDNKRAHYRRLLKSGAQGAGAQDARGVVYGLFWVSTRNFFDDLHYRCWFRIGAGEVLQFAGEIAPERRGGLAAVRVQQRVWDRLHEQGYRRTVCVVEVDNTNSLSLHFGLGFTERGMITEVYRFFRVFSVVRTRRYQGTRFGAMYGDKGGEEGEAIPVAQRTKGA